LSQACLPLAPSNRLRYIDYNPVRDAARPRGQGSVKKNHIHILRPAEISSFLEAENDQGYKTLFMLAILSGARQGEMLGLKWKNIDWVKNQIYIQRTFTEGVWYKPKSETSIRKIDIGPAMMAQLKKWRTSFICLRVLSQENIWFLRIMSIRYSR